MVCIICYNSLFNEQAVEDDAMDSELSQYITMDNRPIVLNCGHVFHKSCIKRWFQTTCRNNCPTCKAQQLSMSIILYIDIAKDDLPDNLENESALFSKNDKIFDSIVELLQKMTLGDWIALKRKLGGNFRDGLLEHIEGLQAELSHQSGQNTVLKQDWSELAEHCEQLQTKLFQQSGQIAELEKAQLELVERCKQLEVILKTQTINFSRLEFDLNI